jgi:phenylalanyl-tRNA synthetase beta chain
MAQDALGLRDIVFDIGVPANRPDCNGHLGLARELAALCGGKLRSAGVDLSALTDDSLDATQLVKLSLEDAERCPRYTARVIDGLTVRPSPRWLRRRLEAVGVRPLSNLVDVSNYVMFELGQPLHAFDFEFVKEQRIIVRRARDGEPMTTLDDVERKLTSDDLLICDPSGGVAVAGVMGGAGSEVADTTTRVLLEAAFFEPRGIRRTAKRLNLHSESSHRFERGVDPNGVDRASARAAQLLAELGGGKVARGIVDAYPEPVVPVTVAIRPARATALTGVELSADDVREALSAIELELAGGTDDSIDVRVPSFRPDITREVDLIEEVLRLHGFDKVPATLPCDDIAPTRRRDLREQRARDALAEAGLFEAVTFAFTSPERIAGLALPEDDPRTAPVAITNPLRGDHSVMRTTLLPNLLGAVSRNLAHGNSDVRLFEVGAVFLPNPGEPLPHERRTAAAVFTGARADWLVRDQDIDFYDVKGAVELLLASVMGEDAGNIAFEAAADVPYLHPGVAARVVLPDGRSAGVLGEVHPNTRRAFDIEPACFCFEIDLERLGAPRVAQLEPIPRFPAITRDLSFFVDAEVPASRVEALISEAEQALLERVTVLEDFRDPKYVPEGKKGMLWSMTYRSPRRTLTDAEVDEAHAHIVERLLTELPAQQR